MNEIIILAVVSIVGAILGIIFFGGLWLTVVKGLPSKNPGLWFIISLLLRVGIVLTGFYYVSGGQWERMLACLFGFIAARFVMIKLVRSYRDEQVQPIKEKEVHHEP